MRLSEFIKELEEFKNKYGDMNIYISEEDEPERVVQNPAEILPAKHWTTDEYGDDIKETIEPPFLLIY